MLPNNLKLWLLFCYITMVFATLVIVLRQAMPVTAIQVPLGTVIGTKVCSGNGPCYTCKDPRRALVVSEDGTRWCLDLWRKKP